MRYLVPGIAAGALWLAACSTGDAPPDANATADTLQTAAAPSPYLRGIAIRGDTPRFVRCGTTDTLRLVDASGTMPARRAGDDVEAIFTIVSGSVSDDSAVTIDRVVYASADRSQCYNDWSGFDYRATGNNPGWVAEVDGSSVHLRRQGDLNFRWSGVTKDSTDGRLRFTAPASGDAGALELVLEAEPCTDRTARTLSMWSARVRVGSDELRGCAVPGR